MKLRILLQWKFFFLMIMLDIIHSCCTDYFTTELGSFARYFAENGSSTGCFAKNMREVLLT